MTATSMPWSGFLQHLDAERELTALRQVRAQRRNLQVATSDIDGSKARCESLVGFIREAWHLVVPDQPYVHNWHIDLICAHLEAITSGRMKALGLENRLLCNVPPGTMKSLLVCVFWPMWEWGPVGRPGLQYIATSYRADYCTRDSNRCRNIVESDWFQARWPLKLVKSGDHYIENEHRGFRSAVPFGSLTGGRADRLLIDDPHSVDGAESEADRIRATMRFRESATSRLNDPITSAIVVIMQRLHQVDISGIILSLKMPYVHIMLPMRFDPARRCVTPFGRDERDSPGEPLFAERFPLSVLKRDEHAMGSHATASQHDQTPTPRGGALFKRAAFKIVPAAPAGCRWVAGWDLAASEEKRSAFTCRVLLGHQPRDRQYYLRHVVRDRVSNPDQMIRNTATQDQLLVGDHEISIPQDPGAAGKIQARTIVGGLAGFQAFYSPESGDKYTRAQPVAAQVEAGNVFLVEGPWNIPFLDEAEVFPMGAYKDQIDAFSRAFARFVSTSGDTGAGPIIVGATRTPIGNHPGQ